MAAPVTSERPLGELLDSRQKWLLIVTLMLSMFVSALNQQIVNTATPRILAELGGFSMLSWVFTVYMLTSTVVTPLVGKLSDIFGRKPFMIGGIALFMVASMGAGFANSMMMLIAFRGLQGIGGGLIMSATFATLGDLFPPAERGKYMGLFTGTFSLASISGPTVGGLLTDTVGWRWCFFVNVPFAILAIVFISANLPARKRTGVRPSIDVAGAILLAAATTALLLGLVWARDEYGWGSAQAIGLIGGAVALTVLFVFQERGHPEAILPLQLFRNREFVVANLVVFLIGGAVFGAVTYLPTFVQTALGASATASGLVTTPQSLGMLTTSIIGGQVVARTGRYRTQTIAGMCVVLVAVLFLQTLDVGTPKWRMSGYMLILGLGFGLVMPTMSVVIQNSVSHQFMGVATSSRQFFMQIGNVLGAAVFGVILASSYHGAFEANLSAEARATIPEATLQEFDDPTLALEKTKLARLKTEVGRLPNGEQLLASTLDAQKEGVAAAIRDIFLVSAVLAGVAIALGFLMKGLPLRRGFAPAPGQPQTAQAPPVPSATVPAAAPPGIIETT